MSNYQKKNIPKTLRLKVFERDRYICRYCGKPTKRPQADHVYPESRGGATIFENLATACKGCNAKKNNRVGIWPFPVGYSKRRAARRKSLDNFGVRFLRMVILLIAILIIFNVALLFTFNLSPAMRIYVNFVNLLAGHLIFVYNRLEKDKIL